MSNGNRSRSDDRTDWKPAPQGIPTLWAMSKPRERGNFSGCGRNNAKSGANHAVWFRRSGVLLRYVPPPAKPAAMCRVPARPCGPEKLPHRTAIILAHRHDRERLRVMRRYAALHLKAQESQWFSDHCFLQQRSRRNAEVKNCSYPSSVVHQLLFVVL